LAENAPGRKQLCAPLWIHAKITSEIEAQFKHYPTAARKRAVGDNWELKIENLSLVIEWWFSISNDQFAMTNFQSRLALFRKQNRRLFLHGLFVQKNCPVWLRPAVYYQRTV
jgi:hypothetical protein